MTKASDNAFPSILITEGTEPSAPAAGKQRLYIDSTTHKLKRTDSSGTDVTIESSGGAVATDTIWDAKGDLAAATGADAASKLTVGSNDQVLIADSAQSTGLKWGPTPTTLIGVTSYAPGSDSTVYTTTTTPALADTTNLAVTFTAPASGKVIVRFTGTPNMASTNADQYWAVWESGSLIGANTRKVSGPNVFGTVTASFYISGISAGSHTYKWAAYKVAAGASLLSAGPTYGTCLMEVIAA